MLFLGCSFKCFIFAAIVSSHGGTLLLHLPIGALQHAVDVLRRCGGADVGKSVLTIQGRCLSDDGPNDFTYWPNFSQAS